MTAKPNDAYYIHSGSKLRRECKQCVMDRQLVKKYGISIAEFKRMESTQKGRCRICKRAPVGPYTRLSVDHCHKSSRVRGLLCSNCNTAIGLLKEDPKRLNAAIRYLQGEDIV